MCITLRFTKDSAIREFIIHVIANKFEYILSYEIDPSIEIERKI